MKLLNRKKTLYTLDHPVPNPDADRRHKYDWTKLPEFPTGDYLVVRESWEFQDSDESVVNFDTLKIERPGAYQFVDREQDGYVVLLSRLKPAPDLKPKVWYKLFCSENCLKPDPLLEQLLISGKVTPEDVQEAEKIAFAEEDS